MKSTKQPKLDYDTLGLLQEGVWVSDSSDKLVFVNAAMGRIAGVDVNLLAGRKLLSFPEDTVKHFLGFFNRAKETLLPCEYECPVVTPSGCSTWQGGWLTPLSEKGRYFGMVCTVRDITVRKNLQVQLADNERRYRTVVEDQTEVISRFLPDGTFVFVNDVYCRLFGKKPEELVGHKWQPIAQVDDVPTIEAKLREMSPETPTVLIENQVYAANGELRWMQFSNRGLFDTTGRLEEIQSVGRDITSLKEAEAELNASEARYRALVETTSTVTWHCPANGLHVAPQPAWMAFTGQSAEEMLGAGWVKAVHPDDVAEAAMRWNTAVERDEPFFNEHRIRRHDGEWRWMRVRAVPVRNVRGQTIEWMGMGQDITDLKQIQISLEEARRQAEQASHGKTRFLAAVSHDLRQPLQAISLLAETLCISKLSDPQRGIATKISNSVNRIGAILDQLLDLSKLDSGMVKAEPTIVSAEDMLSQMDEEFGHLASEKYLKLNLFVSRHCPLLFTDPKLLAMLMRNLVGNAVKYTEQGGVLIALRLRGNRPLVQVWDTGIGIAPSDLRNIFKEYYQVDNPERDRTKGVGLGLAIVSHIAALLDTEVHCRSRLGRGSVFEFELPLLHGTNSVAAIKKENVPSTNGESALQAARKQVVLVEDDKEVAEALKLAFEMRDMQILAFFSAEEAITHPETLGADYYVTDYRLPGIDGVEFLETIRKNSTKAFNAILVSGETSPDRLAHIKAAGWPLLTKPYSFTELLSKLEGS